MNFEMGSNEAGFSSKDSDVMKEKARSESREFGHGIKVKKQVGRRLDFSDAEKLKVCIEEVPESSFASQSSLGGPVDEKGGHNEYVKREVT